MTRAWLEQQLTRSASTAESLADLTTSIERTAIFELDKALDEAIDQRDRADAAVALLIEVAQAWPCLDSDLHTPDAQVSCLPCRIRVAVMT